MPKKAHRSKLAKQLQKKSEELVWFNIVDAFRSYVKKHRTTTKTPEDLANDFLKENKRENTSVSRHQLLKDSELL